MPSNQELYFGELTFSIPYTTGSTTQYFDNNLDYITGSFETSGLTENLSFMAIGSSRLSELKRYGTTGYTQTLDTGNTFSGSHYTGYTIGGLYYMDFTGSYTMITGNTPNFFTSGSLNYIDDISGFATEYVINNMLTRNEHFLGFIEQPRVYSDVFVERGKQGVMEMNLRLGEIDNMGELSIYGNGFFNVKKQ